MFLNATLTNFDHPFQINVPAETPVLGLFDHQIVPQEESQAVVGSHLVEEETGSLGGARPGEGKVAHQVVGKAFHLVVEGLRRGMEA